MVARDRIVEAAHILVSTATSPATVILFGSHARGEADDRSDVDFLVIEDELPDQIAEYVRLRKAVLELDSAVDILVVSREHADARAQAPGSVIRAALREGTVLVERWGGCSTPVLLAKARNDLALLRKIADDPEVADEIVGFHAQQAAEKALKAMLERRSIDYPYTHDLARLLKLLEGPGGAPATRDDMLALTPWATESRYGDAMPASGDTLAFRPIRERAARQRRLSPCVGSQRASSRAGRGP